MDARSSILVSSFLYFSARFCHGFPSNSVNRIINGTDYDIQLAPYMLSFMLDNQYACCAAIVNKYWAVTAAHCVQPAIISGNEITVRSGTSVRYQGGTLHRVIEIIIHENYNQFNGDYDIAAIKVIPPFTYNDRTKAVSLAPDDVEEVSNQLGLVCGWGYDEKINNIVVPVLANRLECIQLPLIKKNECYQDYKFKYTLTSRMTCYGFENGEGDSCKGDSGSPLVNEDNILLGITSWGDGCANPNSPGVYIDTIILRDWIKDMITKM